jgi:nicotinamidase-related amidase
MKKVLLVIDMQNDFIDGALGSPDAQAIVNPVKDRIANAIVNDEKIIYTKDTHDENYMNTNEGKHLPFPHCIAGTKGWEIPSDIYVEGCKVILKPTFGFLNWSSVEEIMNADEIEIIGLVTNICVMSNAIMLKALRPEIKISVNLNCTAATSKEAFDASVQILNSCQVETIGG